jgi:hypothetical protein
MNMSKRNLKTVDAAHNGEFESILVPFINECSDDLIGVEAPDKELEEIMLLSISEMDQEFIEASRELLALASHNPGNVNHAFTEISREWLEDCEDNTDTDIEDDPMPELGTAEYDTANWPITAKTGDLAVAFTVHESCIVCEYLIILSVKDDGNDCTLTARISDGQILDYASQEVHRKHTQKEWALLEKADMPADYRQYVSLLGGIQAEYKRVSSEILRIHQYGGVVDELQLAQLHVLNSLV